MLLVFYVLVCIVIAIALCCALIVVPASLIALTYSIFHDLGKPALISFFISLSILLVMFIRMLFVHWDSWFITFLHIVRTVATFITGYTP